MSDEKPKPKQGFRAYWFGYLYAAFWAYVTYSCATHVIFLLATVQSVPTDVQERARFFTILFLWPTMMIFSGWATYKLLRRTASLGLVYLLVALHGLNILVRGIIPQELVLYVALSAFVILGFHGKLSN